EAVIKGLETAVDKGTPFIMFAASGGARMQEGILSLMQLPRTTVAVQLLREARKPYIVVLTNPPTGGVTASYAMLGDLHIAEPAALIGFAGPRVIEQTIREKLPDGFQRAEYLRDHGMIDMVVPRRELRATLANLCRLLSKAKPRPPVATLPAPAGGGIFGGGRGGGIHDPHRFHRGAAPPAGSPADPSFRPSHVGHFPPPRASPAAAGAGDPRR